MRRTLITGGLGFVGSHFVKRLAATDAVTVVDIKEPIDHSHRYDFDSSVYRRDIRDWMRLGPPTHDLIIHCAAVVGGRQNIEGDPLAVATDLSIDAEFFNWLAKHKFKGKVVYFSSSAAYPIWYQSKAAQKQLKESCLDLAGHDTLIERPDMTYGWAKLTGEYLAQFAAKQYGIDVVIYRPFSGYGEDQDLCYPFPALVKKVVSGESPIVIWGSGDQCRDFIHIDDIVDAVLETMDILQPGEALNLGTGIATSFLSLVDKIQDVTGISAGISCDLTKPIGVFYRVADVTKLHKLYVPKISLDEGIRRMVAHFRS